MDIKSAETHVNSLLKYVKGLQSSESRMYRKSKERLREVATTCTQVVDIISSVLQEEVLTTDIADDDDSSKCTADIVSMVMQMQQEITQLKQFVSYTEPSTNISTNTDIKVDNDSNNVVDFGAFVHPPDVNPIDTAEVEPQPQPEPESKPEPKPEPEPRPRLEPITHLNENNEHRPELEPKHDSCSEKEKQYLDENGDIIPLLPKIPSKVRKMAMTKYGRVLKSMSEQEYDYPIISDVTHLLWTWYESRFFKNKQTGFHYNIRKIPTWIRDIVFAYGKHLHDDDIGEFSENFRKWCGNIEYTDASATYAVPFDVHELQVMPSSEDATLNAVVLYDVLLSCGLNQLTNLSPKELSMNPFGMIELCEGLKPDVLDNYKDFSEHPEILSECNILSLGGVFDE